MSIYELRGTQGSPGSYNAGKIEPYVCRVPAHKAWYNLGCVKTACYQKYAAATRRPRELISGSRVWGSGLNF